MIKGLQWPSQSQDQNQFGNMQQDSNSQRPCAKHGQSQSPHGVDSAGMNENTQHTF